MGDALGGPVEGNTPAVIQQRYGGFVTGIVPPFFENWRDARPMSPYHKGDGHITDDTLMTLALVDVYDEVRDHLDAYDIAERLVPQLMNRVRWIPELERETVILQRIFLAEKWLVARLHYGHIDPREAGVGNIVNCGAAMYMTPVGIANAGDPAGAYAEAIDMAGAHQSSYGREAAGVFAAAVAEAMRPEATVDSVVETAIGRRPRRDEGGDRSGRCRRPQARRLARGARRPARRDHGVRHRRPELSGAAARRPHPEPDEVDRGAARRPRLRHRVGRRLPRRRPRRGQLRPRRRLDRDDGGGDHRRPRRGRRRPVRLARRGLCRQPDRPRRARQRRWPPWRERSGPATPSGRAPATPRALGSDASRYVGAAGGPRPARPRRQAPRRVRRRRRGCPVAGGGRASSNLRRSGPLRRRRATNCGPLPAGCSLSSTGAAA